MNTLTRFEWTYMLWNVYVFWATTGSIYKNDRSDKASVKQDKITFMLIVHGGAGGAVSNDDAARKQDEW